MVYISKDALDFSYYTPALLELVLGEGSDENEIESIVNASAAADIWSWSPTWDSSEPSEDRSLSVYTVFFPDELGALFSDNTNDFRSRYLGLVSKRLEFHIYQWINDFSTEISPDNSTESRAYSETLSMIASHLVELGYSEIANEIESTDSPLSVAIKFVSVQPILDALILALDNYHCSEFQELVIKEPIVNADLLYTLHGDRSLDGFLNDICHKAIR